MLDIQKVRASLVRKTAHTFARDALAAPPVAASRIVGPPRPICRLYFSAFRDLSILYGLLRQSPACSRDFGVGDRHEITILLTTEADQASRPRFRRHHCLRYSARWASPRDRSSGSALREARLYVPNRSPAAGHVPHFLVGRDRNDGWVVIEIHGLCGGLFRDAGAALRYAREESQGCAGRIEIANRPLELRLATKPGDRD